MKMFMSKVQVWKIIFFFNTNRTKTIFFPDWKMAKFFPYFSRLRRNPKQRDETQGLFCSV